MPEWGQLLFWPVYLYLAASFAALLTLATRGKDRLPGAAEATLRASFPTLSLVSIPVAAALGLEPTCRDWAMHQIWHRWETLLHSYEQAHLALHFGNAALLGVILVCLARTINWAARVNAFAGSIALHGSESRRSGLTVFQLNTSRPVCFTAGWLRPRVYLSSFLEERLEPSEIDAVLAHEQEHLRRRDGLIGGLLTVFYTLLPVPGSKALVRDWREATERHCDAAAAKAVGSPILVAEALLRVAGFAQGSFADLCGSPAFAGKDCIEQRIQALLNPAPTANSKLPLILTGCGLLLVVATPLFHHLTALVVHH